MHLPRKYVAPDPKPGPYFASATYLPLSKFRHVLPFLKLSTAIEKQAQSAPGIVAYALRADPISKRFWTYSIWQSRDEARTFVVQGAHKEAMRRFPTMAGPGAAFVDWQTDDANLDWDEALTHLKTPSFRYNPGDARPHEA